MNVGDYVRNEHFGIGKINKDYYDNENKHWYNVKFNCYNDEDCHCGINEKTIGFKSSPNIIDLIEEGDYVNGYKVLNVLDFNDNTRMLSLEKIYGSKIVEEDIKSIVTKECFENMKYEVN